MLAAAAQAAVAAIAPAARGQCPQYEITAVITSPDCGILGTPPLTGAAISDTGEVVGSYCTCLCGTDEAFYWSEETGFVTLDRPPGVFAAMASDISNEGTIVGTYQRNDVGNRGFIYTNGVWTELLPNEGGLYSWANAVSADGLTVVGSRTGALGGSGVSPYQAYVYDVATATFTDLGVMNGPNSWASTIGGAFVAGSTGGSSVSTPFLWNESKSELLDWPETANSASGNAVNATGTVAGGAMVLVEGLSIPVSRPVTWPLGESPIVHPVIAGYSAGTLLGISTAGTVVGRANNGASDERAIVIQNGVVGDLNELITGQFEGILERAVDINDAGQILVRGKNVQDDNVAFVLTPLTLSSADLNLDCAVDALDLTLLLGSWGPCARCTADIDNDGAVGPSDLAQLLADWG